MKITNVKSVGTNFLDNYIKDDCIYKIMENENVIFIDLSGLRK